MRTRFSTQLALAMTLGLLASLALVGGALAAETTLTAQLTGSADTDTDGTGMATVVLDPDAGTACWEMTVANVAPITISHIHVGAAGANGGVVVDLDLDGFESSSEGCNEEADADVIQAILDNPAGYYVNVHNADFPGGAIRGQLAAAGVPSTAVSGPAGTSALVPIGLALLGLTVVIGLRTLRPVARRG